MWSINFRLFKRSEKMKRSLTTRANSGSHPVKDLVKRTRDFTNRSSNSKSSSERKALDYGPTEKSKVSSDSTPLVEDQATNTQSPLLHQDNNDNNTAPKFGFHDVKAPVVSSYPVVTDNGKICEVYQV